MIDRLHPMLTLTKNEHAIYKSSDHCLYICIPLYIFSDEGPKTVTRGEVNGSLKFLLKYFATVPKSHPSPQNSETSKRDAHEPSSGWMFLVMTDEHSGALKPAKN
jgi:hypothetical protein